MGNLTQVQQKGGVSDATQWRPRSFTYDSFSRLLTATNPESGTICYGTWLAGQCVNGYDNDNNLLAKTSPAPNQTGAATVTVNYAYDALNRLTAKTYSTGGGSTYLYDISNPLGVPIQNPVGRLAAEYNYSTSDTQCGTPNLNCVGSVNSYDVMGRLVYQNQFNQRNGQPTQVNKIYNYAYNLDGTLKSITYPAPSNRVVTYTYNVGQRPTQAADAGNTFASAAHYTAWGAIGTLTNGGTINTTNNFNSRMQPVFLSAATSSQTLLSLGYDFNSCNSNSANNGNICQIVNNKTNARSQRFQYDALNRLTQAKTSTSTLWGTTYNYDPWGNLLQKLQLAGYSGTDPQPGTGPMSVNGANRVTSWCYDVAGNVVDPTQPCSTPPPASYPNVYDAENRLSQATVAGVTTSYDYDADGQRVKKSTGTLYWYGPGGEVLDETDTTGATQNEYIFFAGKRTARVDSSGVHYYFSDHLGSASVLSNASGSMIEEESDFYPFGGERVVIGPGPNHYKFTGKERDPETGCDYFGARYYCNTIGRFITPDWAAGPITVPFAKFGDPQSLNLYNYVENAPINRIDADGHDGILGDSSSSPMKEAEEAYDQQILEAYKKSKDAKNGVPPAAADLENSSQPEVNMNAGQVQAQYTEAVSQGIELVGEVARLADPTGLTDVVKDLIKGNNEGAAVGLALAVVPGGSKESKVVHHIASNKAIKSGFTKAFEKIFARAGMTLEDPANKMLVSAILHNSKHPEAYHKMVYDRIAAATDGLFGPKAKEALTQALGRLETYINKHPEVLKK